MDGWMDGWMDGGNGEGGREGRRDDGWRREGGRQGRKEGRKETLHPMYVQPALTSAAVFGNYVYLIEVATKLIFCKLQEPCAARMYVLHTCVQCNVSTSDRLTNQPSSPRTAGSAGAASPPR